MVMRTIHPADTVAVARRELSPGESVGSVTVCMRMRIPMAVPSWATIC